MDRYTVLPNPIISEIGVVSTTFGNLNIESFHAACQYVHDVPYGYNSTREDILILFKEGYGSCTTKHAVIATLAEELCIPVHKMIGIYAMTEDIVSGTQVILEKYHIPYLPMIHCYLVYRAYRIDLTEGNMNGKNRPIEEFLYTEQVIPNISEKDEYLLYKNALKSHILNRREMVGIPLNDVLHARTEGFALLQLKVSHKS